MYIESIRLENVKCFEDVSLTFQTCRKGDQQANWNVIVGNNGDGKTSLLQAIAACLMDTTTASRLLQPGEWVRKGCKTGRLTAKLYKDDGDKQRGRPPLQEKNDRSVQYVIVDGNQELQLDGQPELLKELFPESRFFASATILEPTPEYTSLFENYETIVDDIDYLKRNAFVDEPHGGWATCGYGAFRRISGFASHTVNISESLQKRFITLFEEGAALYDCESWLRDLDRRATKSNKDSKARKTLEEAKRIVLELLPLVDEISIADEVHFSWRGSQVSLGQLSDGYRSMFALAVDLLRWLEQLGPTGVPINEVHGVVLIDEIDSHLHPRWQRTAGFMLTKVFPHIQFIVTTHSPFVVMAAGNSAITLLEKLEDSVNANQDVPYVRGWAADHVLTELFEMTSIRDPETTEMLDQYEDQRMAAKRGALTQEELAQFRKLEAELNNRLDGDASAPAREQLVEDLAYFASRVKRKVSGAAL